MPDPLPTAARVSTALDEGGGRATYPGADARGSRRAPTRRVEDILAMLDGMDIRLPAVMVTS